MAGCELSSIALLDNFCWCSPENPEKLYQLKMALKACHDLSLTFGTLHLFLGKIVCIMILMVITKIIKKLKSQFPPTLLISSIGIIKSYYNLLSIVPQTTDDYIYVIGRTGDEMGGSEFAKVFWITKTILSPK